MSEILATDQFVEKAKEVVTDVIYNIDASCDAFNLNAKETAEVLEKFMLDMFIPNLKDCYLRSLQFALWGEDPAERGYRRVDYSRLRHKSAFELDDICFSTQEEANLVRSKIEEYANQYGRVSIGYLYELMGESGPYTAEYYGWHKDELPNHIIIEVSRKGYRLVFPDPVRLEEFK